MQARVDWQDQGVSLPQMCLCFLVRRTRAGGSQVLLGRKLRGFGVGRIVGLGGKVEEGEDARRQPSASPRRRQESSSSPATSSSAPSSRSSSLPGPAGTSRPPSSSLSAGPASRSRRTRSLPSGTTERRRRSTRCGPTPGTGCLACWTVSISPPCSPSRRISARRRPLTSRPSLKALAQRGSTVPRRLLRRNATTTPESIINTISAAPPRSAQDAQSAAASPRPAPPFAQVYARSLVLGGHRCRQRVGRHSARPQIARPAARQ